MTQPDIHIQRNELKEHDNERNNNHLADIGSGYRVSLSIGRTNHPRHS